MINRAKPCLLLFRGRGIISTLIRWQTRGAYSHAALLLRDGRIIESWQGDGVRVKRLDNWEGIDFYDIPGMTGSDWDDALEFALDKVGSGYDYSGIFRFITRSKGKEDDSWFCSELVYAALQSADCHLFREIPADEVSPGLLAISPLVTPINRNYALGN